MLLEEDSSSDDDQTEQHLPGQEWLAGDISQTCTQICNAQNRACDRSVPLNGTLGLYDEMKSSLSCQRPLLSTCLKSAATRDDDGYCWFENRGDDGSGLCGSDDSNLEDANICDVKLENSPGTERLCP